MGVAPIAVAPDLARAAVRVGPAQVWCSARLDGPIAVAAGTVLGRPVAQPARQVHGAEVAVVDAPGACGDVDAVVTSTPGLAVAIRTADCGPLALVARGGVPTVAAVHVGWRGALAGVVASAAAAVRAAGGTDLAAALGPCISPAAYEFGADDLAVAVDRLGPTVVGRTAAGRPALDLRAAIARACEAAGVELVAVDPACTALATTADGAPAYFSHRARGDAGRQAVVAWIEP